MLVLLFVGSNFAFSQNYSSMSLEELTREIERDPNKVELYEFRGAKYSREGKPQQSIYNPNVRFHTFIAAVYTER
jgi:hypothetical protein